MNNEPTSCPLVGCLLKGSCEMRYFTDARLVFRALGDHRRQFNWLVTDLEWVWLDQREDRPVSSNGTENRRKGIRASQRQIGHTLSVRADEVRRTLSNKRGHSLHP